MPPGSSTFTFAPAATSGSVTGAPQAAPSGRPSPAGTGVVTCPRSTNPFGLVSLTPCGPDETTAREGEHCGGGEERDGGGTAHIRDATPAGVRRAEGARRPGRQDAGAAQVTGRGTLGGCPRCAISSRSTPTSTPLDIEHLHRLAGDWQLLADLSFADLLLWVPERGGDQQYVCVAQVRPNTASTAYQDDQVGKVSHGPEVSHLHIARTQGRIWREGDPVWYGDTPARHEAIPVRRKDGDAGDRGGRAGTPTCPPPVPPASWSSTT